MIIWVSWIIYEFLKTFVVISIIERLCCLVSTTLGLLSKSRTF